MIKTVIFDIDNTLYDYDSAHLSGMMALIREDIKATNDRIDRLRVYLVTQDVTDSQDDLKKIKVKQTF